MTAIEPPRTLVWDLPTRIFHWLLVVSFAGAWLTAESERWRDAHVLLGYTVGGLLVFRLLWGFLGTRYARFSSFVYGPRAVIDYLRSLATRRPQHFVGHNPAGALVIFALLALLAVVVASGWAIFAAVGPEALEELHEAAATATLALVFIHIAGVVVSSRLHRENLVGAMISGYKPVAAPAAAGTRWAIALLLLLAVGLFWSGRIPAPGLPAGTQLSLSAVKAPPPDRAERWRQDDDD
jgi:cytochrome b